MCSEINILEVKNILTKSALHANRFSVNPYIGCAHSCEYCYASFMKQLSRHSESWGGFIDVKYWPVIKNPQKYANKELFIGTVTDPYQPLEENHRRTRALLEQMKDCGCKINITTKSDLILRDLDLIKTFPDAYVSWSINTLDEIFQKDMDRAVSIERRLNAMKTFHDAGIKTVCLISPIFPGITNIPAIIQRTRNQCSLIWLENLHLRGSYKANILNYISHKYPELKALYEAIYQYKDESYWKLLDSEIQRFSEKENLSYAHDGDSIKWSFDSLPIIINYFSK